MDVVQPESGEDYSLRFTFWGSIPPPPAATPLVVAGLQ